MEHTPASKRLRVEKIGKNDKNRNKNKNENEIFEWNNETKLTLICGFWRLFNEYPIRDL